MAIPPRSRGRRTGRSPGSPPNRVTILVAARREFADLGYEGATMRSIAAAAGVDAALVYHYFGTKDGLLLAALRPETPEELFQLVGSGFDGLGERFLRLTLKVYGSDFPGGWATMIGLLRSSTTHADAARLLRESFARGGIGRLVEALGVPQPRLRAALVGAELVGLIMARYVVRLEPLASADAESLIAWYAPALDGYLTGPLAGDEGC